MTVFKTFFKVAKKNKTVILIYLIMLIAIGSLNKASQTNNDFSVKKSKVLIVNNDTNSKIVDNMIDYFDKNSHLVKYNDKEMVDDLLFYRRANIAIFIPKGYTDGLKSGNYKNIEYKKSNDYYSMNAVILLQRYLNIQTNMMKIYEEEKDIIKNINETINSEVEIKFKDKNSDSKNLGIVSYYNFASYSIMGTVILIIGFVLSSFREEKISRRSSVSSTSMKRFNFELFLGCLCFTIIVFVIFTLTSLFLIGKALLSEVGLMLIINSFVFTLVVLSLAILLGNLIKNKESLSGATNVIALGSAFLCGAFVPSEYLPSAVIKVSKVLPTYWYVNTNDMLGKISSISLSLYKSIFINFGVLLIFMIVFIIINKLVYVRKLKR